MKTDLDYFDVFPWNDNFNTGIEIIDSQHKKLVELLNKLAGTLVKEDQVEILSVFDELADYANYHFETEEEIWSEHFADDSWLGSHQLSHASFLPKVLEIKAQESYRPLRDVIESIVKFLIRWLAFHIIDDDKKMSLTIKGMESGMSLIEAKIYADKKMSSSVRVLIDTVLTMYDGLSSRTLELMRERSERKITEETLKDTNKALLEREAMLNQAQSAAKVGCWKWELESDNLQLSDEAKRIYGVDPKESQFTNEVFSAKIPDSEKEMVTNAINETIFYKKNYHIQHHVYSDNAEPKMVEQFGELSVDSSGKVIAMLGVVKDVSEQTESEYELKLARNVFNHSAEAILVTDPENRVLKINPAFVTITGFKETEIRGQKIETFFKANRHTDEFYERLWSTIETKDLWAGELWGKRKNGEVYPTQQTISTVRDNDGQIVQYIHLLRDITTAKEQEEYIHNLAHYDQLTGLPNRTLFMDRIRQSIIRSKRKNSLFALLFIDLDRFKYVNDTLGHDAGDELLVVIAQRLHESVREQDTIARLGGDEFTLILEEIAEQDDSLMVTQKIIEHICEPITIHGHEVVVGASIGVSVYPLHGEEEDLLIKCADTAMYRAKDSGRNQGKLYDESMLAVTSEKFHLEMLLRKAVEEEELELYFQPQVNLTTARASGCEALVRWNHPEHGVIGPVDFIPLAEETGLIIPLGLWVLRKSLELCAKWETLGIDDLTMSVNVSSKQLSETAFLQQIKDALHDYKVPPEKLELEITESAVMDNPLQVIAMLQQVRELGVNISLDDFGTGYSSLSYLKKLPVTKVKIDRSFVRDVNIDKDDEGIVKAIIAMTNSLGLKVIAEGTESKDHIDFIRSTDCEDVQGYYYSRPLPEPEFLDFVRQFNQVKQA